MFLADGLVMVLSAITSHMQVLQVSPLCTHTYTVSQHELAPCSPSPLHRTPPPPHTQYLLVSQFSSSKIKALYMLKAISQHIRDEFILDRVVPYLVGVGSLHHILQGAMLCAWDCGVKWVWPTHGGHMTSAPNGCITCYSQMHCVSDPMATVKVEAIRTLTHCLGMIRKLVKRLGQKERA